AVPCLGGSKGTGRVSNPSHGIKLEPDGPQPCPSPVEEFFPGAQYALLQSDCFFLYFLQPIRSLLISGIFNRTETQCPDRTDATELQCSGADDVVPGIFIDPTIYPEWGIHRGNQKGCFSFQ